MTSTTSRRLRALLAVAALAAGLTVGACGTRPTAAPGVAGVPTPVISARVETPEAESSEASAPPTPVPPTPAPASTPTAAPSDASTDSPAPTPAPTPSMPRCTELAQSLSLRDQVGQLMMVAVSSYGVTSSDARAIDDTRAGSIILLGNTTAGAADVREVTKAARAAARTPKGIEPMLAADQEGGLVQRLRGPGFDRIPSAREQADESPEDLAVDARRWGKQLKRAGIDANLAPVADVVPAELQGVNQPIGVLRRGYGSNPTKVGSHVAAFVTGMDDADIATAVKHFPGLGRVRGNTDFTAKVVDATTTRQDPYLKPFAAGVDAGTDMVMMSSAYYSEIDSSRRAAFSPIVIKGVLRGDLGFTGVVISDDLAARAMQDLRPTERMLRFVRAGGDLAIVGDPSIAESMADGVVEEARDDDKLAAQIEAATVRVLVMKDRRGLASC